MLVDKCMKIFVKPNIFQILSVGFERSSLLLRLLTKHIFCILNQSLGLVCNTNENHRSLEAKSNYCSVDLEANSWNYSTLSHQVNSWCVRVVYCILCTLSQ